MPAHRGKIVTALRESSKLPDAAAFIRKELEAGRQAYIVYPLIEESDKLEAKAAAQEFEKWQKLLAPMRCELLHGRIDPAGKDALMEKFRAGQAQALIATSVIEVGIDVPNATIMLIENAERFGLAQLHQLRGRVGRGTRKSWCILISDATDAPALEKLKTLEETTDGFKIAEADLRLRGPGDILGTAQSGLPPLKLGNLLADQAWMRAARAAAVRLFNADPQLEQAENRGFRDLITGQRKLMLAQIS
jgi:ATP-dependent DNA helicase RecG